MTIDFPNGALGKVTSPRLATANREWPRPRGIHEPVTDRSTVELDVSQLLDDSVLRRSCPFVDFLYYPPVYLSGETACNRPIFIAVPRAGLTRGLPRGALGGRPPPQQKFKANRDRHGLRRLPYTASLAVV